MENKLRDCIIKAIKTGHGNQIRKDKMVEIVNSNSEFTNKEILSEYSSMKKDGLVYSVSGLNGWVGLYE